MNALTRLRDAAGTALRVFGSKITGRVALTAPYLSHLLYLIQSTFRDLATEAYGGNAAVYACLRLLCAAVPEPPLIVYTRQPDGQPGEPVGYQHPLSAIIRQPNPLMTEFEMWEMITLHLGIVGTSHWYKERNHIGGIKALWPLRPDRVGPIYAGPADIDEVLIGWSYLVPGTTDYLQFPRNDIITYNLPDPMGESGGIVEGLGPLQVLASEVGADNEATRFVGSLVSNYALPGMILQTKNAIPDENTAKVLKAAFQRDFGGIRRGQPAVVDAGTTVTSMGFSLRDLEFPDLRRVSESRIAAAFQVPAVLVGLLVGLQAAIKATTDELRALFAETTLTNYWRRYADQFTNDMATEYGDDLICRFDLSKVRALNAQTAIDLVRIKDAYAEGALTKNEYRIELGYPKRADGDVYAYGIGQGRGMQTMVDANGEDPNMDSADPGTEGKGTFTPKVPGPSQDVAAPTKSATRRAKVPRRTLEELTADLDDAKDVMAGALADRFAAPMNGHSHPEEHKRP